MYKYRNSATSGGKLRYILKKSVEMNRKVHNKYNHTNERLEDDSISSQIKLQQHGIN